MTPRPPRRIPRADKRADFWEGIITGAPTGREALDALLDHLRGELAHIEDVRPQEADGLRRCLALKWMPDIRALSKTRAEPAPEHAPGAPQAACAPPSAAARGSQAVAARRGDPPAARAAGEPAQRGAAAMSCDGSGPASALHLVLEPSPEPVPAGPVPDPAAGPDAGPGTAGTMVPATPGPAPEKAVRIWLAATVIAKAKRIAAKSHRNRGVASLASEKWRDLYAKPPGSIEQHRAHVKAAAWFPAGYEDTWLIWVRRAWTAYHVTAGRGLKVTGNGISALGDKGRRVAVLLLLAVIAVTIVVLT